jgi:hypothetical protein
MNKASKQVVGVVGLGYHPQVILAGRRINDGMGKFIAEKTVKMMMIQADPRIFYQTDC